MKRRDRIGPPCKAYRADGRICGKPSTELSVQRGCMVCPEHADPKPAPTDSVGYVVCPRCKRFIETRQSQPLLTHCPGCGNVLAHPGPSKEEIGR